MRAKEPERHDASPVSVPMNTRTLGKWASRIIQNLSTAQYLLHRLSITLIAFATPNREGELTDPSQSPGTRTLHFAAGRGLHANNFLHRDLHPHRPRSISASEPSSRRRIPGFENPPHTNFSPPGCNSAPHVGQHSKRSQGRRRLGNRVCTTVRHSSFPRPASHLAQFSPRSLRDLPPHASPLPPSPYTPTFSSKLFCGILRKLFFNS